MKASKSVYQFLPWMRWCGVLVKVVLRIMAEFLGNVENMLPNVGPFLISSGTIVLDQHHEKLVCTVLPVHAYSAQHAIKPLLPDDIVSHPRGNEGRGLCW